MKDVGQEATRLVGVKIGTDTNCSLSPSNYSCRQILADASSTTSMRNNETLVNQWQHLLQVTVDGSHDRSVVEKLVATIGGRFPADACLIALPNSQVKCWFSDPSVVVSLAIPTVETLFTQLLDGIDPVAISNVAEAAAQADPNSFAARLIDAWQVLATLLEPVPRVQSILGMAIRIQGNTIGCISLMRSHSHPWSFPELEELRMVSYQVGAVLSQQRLQDQAAKQRQYQTVVNQLTMAIRNSSDVNAILKQATDGTAQAIGVDRAMLLRLKYWDPLFKTRIQEQTPKIRAVVVCEWLSDQGGNPASTPIVSLSDNTPPLIGSPAHSFWLSECALCQQAFTHSSYPLVIHSKQDLADFELLGNVASVFNLNEMTSLLLAPLESQGTILGFLVLQYAQPHTWQREEVELVELVSAQVSTAIIQAETLRQVQGLVEKRTAELQQSLSIQAKLYERTRQQLEQLRHLNHLKDEFLSTISHELRTPLTSMTMAIRMLRQIGTDSDRSARYLDILEQQCAQETNLINDLLALQELESKQVAIQLEAINLRAVLEDLAALFQQRWATKGLTLSLDLPPTGLCLYSDRDSLNRILLELLTNAGKYSEPNSQVRLRVTQESTRPASTMIKLSLSNIGAGISAEELPFIFDKFRRGQGSTCNAVQGTGLGLALVRSLVQLIGGTISAASTPEKGTESYETCFTLNLPQALDSVDL